MALHRHERSGTTYDYRKVWYFDWQVVYGIVHTQRASYYSAPRTGEIPRFGL